MKTCLILAVTFAIAQAVTHPLKSPVNAFRNFNPVQYQGQVGYNRPSLGIAGRPVVSEILQQEAGNFYAGNREGRYLTRDSGDNYRGLQYSVRPQRDFSSYRNQPVYQQQGVRRFQSGDSYGYRNPQITFNSPLANTRSYNPRLEATGNLRSEYRF